MKKPDKELLQKLGNLGFQMFEAEEAVDAGAALADVVKSDDLRLWEGFPVVLANSSERGLLNYGPVRASLEKGPDRAALEALTAVSLALYKGLELRFSWSDKLYASLSDDSKKKYADYLEKLRNGEDVQVAQHVLSGQRLRSVFSNYFSRSHETLSDLLAAREELGLEYAMSQVFSPKQKELFLKRVKREKFSKTDKEYYSRTVRKKVLALANPELHRLARKLLES